MSVAPRPRGRQGFTLVEILLTLGLLAVVVTLVQGVYSSVLRSRDHAQEQAEKSHAAALLLGRLADELASCSPRAGDPTGGLTLERDENLDSRLEFTTPVPALVQEEGVDEIGGAATLTYSLEAGENGARDLVRLDSRAPSVPGSDRVGDVLLRGLSRFRVKLLREGDDWEETSGTDGTAPKPPRAVAVEVAWKDGKAFDGPEHVLRTLVPLYGALAIP